MYRLIKPVDHGVDVEFVLQWTTLIVNQLLSIMIFGSIIKETSPTVIETKMDVQSGPVNVIWNLPRF